MKSHVSVEMLFLENIGTLDVFYLAITFAPRFSHTNAMIDATFLWSPCN